MGRKRGFNRRCLLPVFAMEFLLAGCAGLQSVDTSQLPFKQCSKSFIETVRTLVLGVTESSLTLIRKVLPEDLQWYKVVDGKDEMDGLREVGQIKKYPGPPLNEMLEEYVTQFSVIRLEPFLGRPDEKIVWLEREDTILEVKNYRPLRKELRYRRFIVRYSPRGNCVTSVRPYPVDKTWISRSEFQALTGKTLSVQPTP